MVIRRKLTTIINVRTTEVPLRKAATAGCERHRPVAITPCCGFRFQIRSAGKDHGLLVPRRELLLPPARGHFGVGVECVICCSFLATLRASYTTDTVTCASFVDKCPLSWQDATLPSGGFLNKFGVFVSKSAQVCLGEYRELRFPSGCACLVEFLVWPITMWSKQ